MRPVCFYCGREFKLGMGFCDCQEKRAERYRRAGQTLPRRPFDVEIQGLDQIKRLALKLIGGDLP